MQKSQNKSGKVNISSSLFDSIRVKPSKYGSSAEHANKIKQCAFEKCEAAGSHKGPTHKNQNEIKWYCTKHISKANASYNFFEGMSDGEIQQHMKEKAYGGRKTRPINNDPNSAAFNLDTEKSFKKGDWNDRFKSENTSANKDKKVPKSLRNAPPATLKALQTMGLTPLQASPENIKVRFRDLVKKLHPDANGNLPHATDQLRKVIEAHALLRKIGLC